MGGELPTIKTTAGWPRFTELAGAVRRRDCMVKSYPPPPKSDLQISLDNGEFWGASAVPLLHLVTLASLQYGGTCS